MSIGDNNCSVCSREVAEKGNSIACDICDLWFHSKCVKIPQDVFRFLSDKKDASEYGLYQWICPSCQGGSSKIMQHIHKLNVVQTEQKKCIEDLKLQVAKLMSWRPKDTAGIVIANCSNDSSNHTSKEDSVFDKSKTEMILEVPPKTSYSKIAARVTSRLPNPKGQTIHLPVQPSSNQYKAEATEFLYLKKEGNIEQHDPMKVKQLLTDSLKSVEILSTDFYRYVF